MKAGELKACPFCGSNNINVFEQHSPTIGRRWSVACDECLNCHHDCRAETAEKAIESWNTRTPPTNHGVNHADK